MTMNLKQIDASIASIAKRGKGLRIDAHKTLVAIIDHYIGVGNGDHTRLPKLQEVVDKTFGRSALKALNQWVQDYVTSLKWDKEENKFVHIKGTKRTIRDIEIKANEKKGLPAFKGNARDWSFFNCEVKTPPAPFVLADSFKTLLVRAEKAYEASIATGADLKLKAQIEILKSLHLEDVAPTQDEPVTEKPVAEVVPASEVKRPKEDRKIKSLAELNA